MPFELIAVGEWLMEVDREATQMAYQQGQHMDACRCASCQNYVAACLAHTAYTPTSLAFFEQFGIIPEKVAEVYSLYANQEKTHVFYGGWYHCVGRMVKRPEEPAFTAIDGQLEVVWTEQVTLLPHDFPQPALHMEFQGWIPWVLDDQDALLTI